MTSETLSVRILVSWFPPERGGSGPLQDFLGHLASLPGKLVPKGPSCLLPDDAYRRLAFTGDWLGPGRVGLARDSVMHSWAPPQSKNRSALLGRVLTHSLAWQLALWKANARLFQALKTSPCQAPASSPHIAVLIYHNLILSGKKNKEKKAL